MGGMAMDLVDRVCTAYAWQRALGHDTVRHPLCCMVRDRAHPEVWDANHVSQVRARTAAEIEQVLQQAEEVLGHCRHRLFVVDPLTPAAFVARLVLDDYRELEPTLQLVLEGQLQAQPRAIALRPVRSEEDWQSLHALLLQDHAEGARTQGESVPAQVTQGMVAGYRKESTGLSVLPGTRGRRGLCLWRRSTVRQRARDGGGPVHAAWISPARDCHGCYRPGDHPYTPPGCCAHSDRNTPHRAAQTALCGARLCTRLCDP
jgi:hypothetical protein